MEGIWLGLTYTGGQHRVHLVTVVAVAGETLWCVGADAGPTYVRTDLALIHLCVRWRQRLLSLFSLFIPLQINVTLHKNVCVKSTPDISP